ncbi:receptor-like serine/threonine-protein kinase SD1-7 isoform X1 [Zingiber officinale]|uniref:receptor-like serine/threonine-protein kinase SD1-7 isoform X1 n=1 Tax=Zingiber officinale TaxID=94328 RepID=UPI001C4AABA6|nr:receptor-like serine/threonine-protein kinase SD1-7 isoform X1 [Zingiber officinale]
MARMQLFLLQFFEIVLAETFFLLGQSSSGDILLGNNSLIDGQTLISMGSVFQLGFFSPVNNSATAYIGIWYYNLPPRENKVVVWVANRNKSVDTSMASLNLTSDGNLILFEKGIKVWSTGTSAELNSPRLQLLDSGNLALTDGNSSRTLWQSFDHGCDTLLPGMKIGFDFRTNTSWQFMPWMSATDPSPGKYVAKMEAYNVPDFFTQSVDRYVKLGRTGPWNGQWFTGLPTMGNSILVRNVNFTYVSNQNETYYMTEYQTRSSRLNRLVVDANLTYKRWIFDGRDWRVFLSFPSDDCDYYNHCGRNSVCTKGYYSTSCRCLEGFVENKKVVGCARKEPLLCSSNQFSKEQNMKVPDTENATSRGKISLDACKKSCLDDCSCVAYAVINGPYGCITWRGELLDLRSFIDGGDDLYIRLPESSTSNWKELVWAIVVIPVLLGILLLCCAGVLARRRRNRASTSKLQLQFPKVQKDSISTLDVLPSYDLRTIKAATNDFSERNKLGEGGFGIVYKGQLEDEQKIAVKKLSRYSSQGPDEFQNELSLIAKLQHRNLVRLLGCCMEGDERLLILEYMENKSLDAFIYDKTKSSLLNWQKRFNIIIGIARGLLYLHQDSRLRVIHRDLKPSNILLDKDMNPKISDFGIARIFEGDNALEDATTRPVGTFGYMAPEYISYGLFSFKSDVFSFGVIVLEIISGKKNRIFSQTDTSLNLLGYVYKLWKEGRSLEILDDTLNESYTIEEVLRCIQMSLLCIQDNSEDRPTMTEVMTMLASEDQLLTPLKQPTITTTNSEGSLTTNEMSFTLVGR